MAAGAGTDRGRRRAGQRGDLPGARALILYLDGSALLKLVLIEPGTDLVEELWESRSAAAASAIAYTEVASAITAAGRGRRISVRRHHAALSDLDEIWACVHVHDVDPPLALVAGALTARHGLRALDALHLATALSVGPAEPVVVSWDADLRRAAEADGLALAPA